MKHIAIFSVMSTLLFFSTTAQAAPERSLEGLEALRRSFAGLSDFTADITQEKHLSLMKQKLVSHGVVRFRKPGLFYMELYPPYASRLLIKDNILTVKLPDQGTTDRIPLSPEESLERWLDYLAKPVAALPEGVEVKADRRGQIWTVQIFPKKKGGVKELRIIFDSEGRIRQLLIEERNQDRTVVRFTNMRRNVGLKEKEFTIE
jgi:outer membrane lipoprotein carrier protein